MRATSVLISGAGIAGSSAAYWLARRGWNVTVVEKATAIRSSGNPVDVRGGAAAIAREMGIWAKLREQATRTERLVFVDRRGRVRAAIATRKSSDPEEEVEIARADLAAALLESVHGQAEILHHESVTRLRQDRGGVDVEFMQVPPRRFDLVIGADGLHSNVRRIAFGPEADFARGFAMFVGTLRTLMPVGDPRTVVMYNEPGISLSVHPAGGKPLAAFIFRSVQAFDHQDRQAPMRLLRHSYAHAGWLSPQVLAEWETADDVYFDAVTRIRVPRWNNGRIGLLGDAADCLSLLGEGSSNAIVAAKTLSDALKSHPDDYSAAFAAYENTHRKQLRPYLRGATPASHFLVPASAAGLALRNTGIRLATFPSRHRPISPHGTTP
ncbi:FAD-dependent oxidoreductase [Arthrobacter sp. NPDC056727]|uniref:FAD-dependent oxidoreductase n=1 Tax=Arthrobacter sp. NPDC056727 TaxID=3345927 RepID=UPI00366A7114